MAIPNSEQTQKMLNREEKVNIRIPTDKNNPKYVTERVYVNGLCIQIPVGENVEVPKTIANLLEKKGII